MALLILAAQLTAWEFAPDKTRVAASAALRAATHLDAFVADAQLIAGQARFIEGSAACIDHYRAAATAAARTGDLDLEFEARASEASALQAFGDATGAIESALQLEQAATAAGKTMWARQSEWRRARIEWLRTGSPAPAIETFKRLLHGPGVGLHRPQLLGELALALADRGDVEEARRVVREAVRVADTRWTQGISAVYRAEIEWASGQMQRTLTACTEALSENPPQALVTRSTRLWALFELGQPQGDDEIDGLTVIPLLEPVRLENLALRQLAGKDPMGAVNSLDAAAAGWAGNVTRCELRSLWGKAEVLRGLGEIASARDVLTALESRAAVAGLVPLLGRVRASLRKTQPQRPRHAEQKLSSRERETLALVRQDLPTKTIAERLAISPRTVDSHIASAMSKLGARTRKQAAALEARQSNPTAADLDATPQEKELLRLLAAGHPLTEAAAQAGISRRTASRRLRRVRQRNGITSTTAIAHWVSLNGRPRPGPSRAIRTR